MLASLLPSILPWAILEEDTSSSNWTEGLPEVNGEPQDLSTCLLYLTSPCLYLATAYPSLFYGFVESDRKLKIAVGGGEETSRMLLPPVITHRLGCVLTHTCRPWSHTHTIYTRTHTYHLHTPFTHVHHLHRHTQQTHHSQRYTQHTRTPFSPPHMHTLHTCVHIYCIYSHTHTLCKNSCLYLYLNLVHVCMCCECVDTCMCVRSLCARVLVYMCSCLWCACWCVCVCVSMCVCGHWWLSGLHLIESLGAQAPARFPFNNMMAIRQTSSSHQSTQLWWVPLVSWWGEGGKYPLAMSHQSARGSGGTLGAHTHQLRDTVRLPVSF